MVQSEAVTQAGLQKNKRKGKHSANTVTGA